jgi:hypothetical protein
MEIRTGLDKRLNVLLAWALSYIERSVYKMGGDHEPKYICSVCTGFHRER